jgi:molybdopterin converting factor small subunit
MATVHVYPPYRAIVGSDRLELDFPPDTPLRRVLELLAERFPPFRAFAEAPSSEFLWGQLIVHVNDEIAGLDSPIQPTDRLDLLPPIAGGEQKLPRPAPTAPQAC